MAKKSVQKWKILYFLGVNVLYIMLCKTNLDLNFFFFFF